MVNIAVIGAGVNGLGCALRIKQTYPSLNVTIISKLFSPNTTGDRAAGLWGPYLCGNTPSEKMMQWGKETHDFFHSLWLQGTPGVCLLPVIRMNRDPENKPTPAWAEAPYGFRTMRHDEVDLWSKQHSLNYTGGITFVSFTCEPAIVLPILMKKFIDAGGKLIEREVKSLGEIAELGYNVIINCTGLGSREVVPDKKSYAIRGQVSRVKAPWMRHVILDDTKGGNYIIPNSNDVVLGGTSQVDDYNTKVDPVDTEFIHRGCEKMIPGLKHAALVNQWAGLRPGRESVRLEREDIIWSHEHKVTIVHNYGHGGCGISLFWGCAKEVIDILENDNIVKQKMQSHL